MAVHARGRPGTSARRAAPSVDKPSVDKLTVDKLSVDKPSVDKLWIKPWITARILWTPWGHCGDTVWTTEKQQVNTADEHSR